MCDDSSFAFFLPGYWSFKSFRRACLPSKWCRLGYLGRDGRFLQILEASRTVKHFMIDASLLISCFSYLWPLTTYNQIGPSKCLLIYHPTTSHCRFHFYVCVLCIKIMSAHCSNLPPGLLQKHSELSPWHNFTNSICEHIVSHIDYHGFIQT